MPTMERKTVSKAKNPKISRHSTSKKAIAKVPQNPALARPARETVQGPREFVRTEPSVAVFEIVETEVYAESDTDDRDKEFGT
jgi:hypothetical protein